MTDALTLGDLSRAGMSTRKVQRLGRHHRFLKITALGRLAAEQLDALYAACNAVSAHAFSMTTLGFWEEHRRLNKYVDVAGLILVADASDAVVGYSEFSRWQLPEGVCLYFHTAFHPSHQRRGLGPRLHSRLIAPELMRRPHRTLYVAGRTRTPSVLARATKALGPDNVHPQPDRPVPDDVRRVARRLFDLRFGQPSTEDATLLTRLVESELRVVGKALDVHPEEFPSSGNAGIDAHFEKLGPDESYLTIQLISLSAWLSWNATKALARARG